MFDLLCLVDEGGNWKQALADWDGDPAWYIDRTRDEDEVFPWDRLDIGVDKEYMWKEWLRFHKGVQTPPCPASGCEHCGRCGLDMGMLCQAQCRRSEMMGRAAIPH